MGDYKYYDVSENRLLDDDIVEDLHMAADMYENGEVLEITDILVEIVESINAYTYDCV